jgi:RNA polymerase sigma factor (sigma-70 family)
MIKHPTMTNSLDFNQMLLTSAEFLKPFAATLTRDLEDAKDLFQETVYRALANKEKYISGTNIKAWLYTIMRNIFINNYRRKSKTQVVLDNTPNDFFLNYNTVTVSNAAISNINMKDIHKAIFELPEIFKKPFALYFDGYKYNEISRILKEPLGTIKSRIHFARKLLKKQIERF